MPSYSDDKYFKEAVIPNSLLDDAIDWIRTNLKPEDVFDKKQLEEWTRDSDFIHINDKS